MSKRNPEVHVRFLLDPRRAQHERAIIAVDEIQHQALPGGVVVWATVQEWLDQTEGWIVVEVVHELDVTTQRFRHLRIESVHTVSHGLIAQKLVQSGDGLRE